MSGCLWGGNKDLACSVPSIGHWIIVEGEGECQLGVRACGGSGEDRGDRGGQGVVKVWPVEPSPVGHAANRVPDSWMTAAGQ